MTEGTTIRDWVLDLLAKKSQWSSGEAVTIVQAQGCEVYVSEGGRDGGGLLFLNIRNSNPFQVVSVICGYIGQDEAGRFGWVSNLTDAKYDQWVTNAKAKVVPGDGNGHA